MNPNIPNPYAPPSATVAEDKPKVVGTLAILLGASIGNGLAYAVLSVSGVVFVWVLTAEGVLPQDLYLRAYQSTSYLVFAHLLGLICLASGGYWTARFSRERPFRNAGIAGMLLSLFSLVQVFVPYHLPIPLWSQIVSILIPAPTYLLGAYLWRRWSP